jgi:hypothetical protein
LSIDRLINKQDGFEAKVVRELFEAFALGFLAPDLRSDVEEVNVCGADNAKIALDWTGGESLCTTGAASSPPAASLSRTSEQKKFLPQTPAMPLGLTDCIWPIRDLLLTPVFSTEEDNLT